MTASVLAALVLVSLACAAVLAVGGRRGPATANPWWSLLAAVSLLLTLHVLGFYLPGVRWVSWAALALTLAASVPAGLRERDLWHRELLPAPRDRDRYLEIGLFFLAVLGAVSLAPSLPQAHRVTLVLLAFIPFLLVRWAATRLGHAERRG